MSDLVAVVIPAWNAAATIGATLDSVRAQTHGALEIVVVDDGSTDGTPDIVRRHEILDPRVRLIRQDNAGVAVARNTGIAQTTAAFIAPVDADDLWAADKIARQLAVFADGDERLGLVYCGYAVIDEGDRSLRRVLPDAEGDVRAAITEANFVGNGSSPLIRRAALEQVGGYDASLRAAGAQGCEDHMIYFRIALNWTFGVVRHPLVGYRLLPDAMSRDADRMLRSHALCLAAFAQAWPEGRLHVERGRAAYRRWMLSRVVTVGPLPRVPALFFGAARYGVVEAALAAARGAARRFRGQSRASGPRFAVGTPGVRAT